MLHAPAFPRFYEEPEELLQGPAWFCEGSRLPRFDPEHDAELRDGLARCLARPGFLH